MTWPAARAARSAAASAFCGEITFMEMKSD
jgi:hypothetical protein